MDCPSCGGDSGVVGIVVGIVRIETYHCCECHRVWKHTMLLGEFAPSQLEEELLRLTRVRMNGSAKSIKIAINFIQARLDCLSAEKLGQGAIHKRRLDAWERKFLRDAIGDDYE